MHFKYTLIACVLSAVIAGVLTKIYSTPKTVEVTRDVTHTEIQVVTHTVKLPSGEVDTTTTTNQDIKQVDTDNKSVPSPIIPKNWLVSGTYGTDIHTLMPAYGVDVKRRILGLLFIGGNADSSGRIGLTLGMEF